MASRKRAQTVGHKLKQSTKALTKIERHTLFVRTVNQLGYDMSVFHLRWMPGEYLDEDTLELIPVFWFKKFGWIRQDIEKLYESGQVQLTAKRKKELTIVFGKGPGRKGKRKESAVAKSVISEQEEVDTPPVKTNKDDIYLRTRRLLKKVEAVPSKVRLIDNQSEMNITNSGFPDLSFIRHGNQPSPGPITDSAMHANNELSGIEEDEEEVKSPPMFDNNSSSTSVSKSPRKNGGHRSTNSISTPFGDVDTNTMINLRAKHRRTSSLAKRISTDFSMKQYADVVWNKLAVQSGRGDTLKQSQFDIELYNNQILADPDICQDMFKTIQAENPVNKKQINKEDFERVCVELDKIPLVNEIARDTLKENDEQKIWIILKQVFVHIAQAEPFDVASYLSVKLTTNDLNNVDLLLEYISSRHTEWTTRLQILEWITANLETSETIQKLTSDENIGPFLLGWMCQCLDERSNLAKSALEMFPNVLSIAMTQNGEAFQFLDDIFSSLFLVLRNKRSKDLNDTADDCCIQCIDMIMDWHEHGELDDEVLWELCQIFGDNTNVKEQKHDKVRERCVAYFGYILYGIQGVNNAKQDEEDGDDEEEMEPESPALDSSSPNGLALNAPPAHLKAKSADYAGDDEEKWVPSSVPSWVGQKEALKISKLMKRKYLLHDVENENEDESANADAVKNQFVQYINDALQNGLNDKSGDTRNTAFKLLSKLEKEENGEEILSQILSIDALAMSKYNKWKERKNRSKKGGKKSSMMKKRMKVSNRTRIKANREHIKNTSVTLTIDAQ
eukprot:CAMPEP_0197053654 /NCGR_PEP_ID=MMETSP1384-20130603/27871_1 /TAXON_ID=29189 /ORGANISM="Ammonia sp." /LENGTH=787 /DNA_ID=CAMNT_0042486587 /DNA_START=27 /DNA_END=2390 /DNA_ORIENTATION=-